MHLSSVPTVILFASVLYGQANGNTAADTGSSTGIAPTVTETSVTTNPQVTSTTTTPATSISPSSSISVMATESGSAGPSGNGTSGVAVSTTVRVASGSNASHAMHATNFTTTSASPTSSKKSVAGHLRGFTGTAGILLLVGILAGL